MKGRLLGVVAILLATAAARADVVILDDGREIKGKASIEGAKVVIRSEHGETSFPRDSVVKIKSEDDLKREEEAEKKRKEAEEKEQRERNRVAMEDIFKAFAAKQEPPKLAAAEALSWEKDPASALKLASEQKKIVLEFSVLGELGTGHC
jgi:hypothetical protein